MTSEFLSAAGVVNRINSSHSSICAYVQYGLVVALFIAVGRKHKRRSARLFCSRTNEIERNPTNEATKETSINCSF